MLFYEGKCKKANEFHSTWEDFVCLRRVNQEWNGMKNHEKHCVYSKVKLSDRAYDVFQSQSLGILPPTCPNVRK